MTGNVQDVPFYSGDVDDTSTYFVSSDETSVNSDIGDTAFGGGLFVGYGKVLNNSKFYVGGEAYARYAHDTTHTTTTQNELFYVGGEDVDPENAPTASADMSSSIDVKSDWSYGAALKLGYVVTPKTMIYVLLGAEYSKFKVDASHSLDDATEFPTTDVDFGGLTDSYSYDENKVAFVPGVGIETMLTDKLSLKAEYTYADYGSIVSKTHEGSYEVDVTDPTIVTANVNTHAEDKVDLKRGLFSLGLAYHFNGI
jgi:opacity protein-like surface antigen